MPNCVDDLTTTSEVLAKVNWGNEPPGVVGDAIEELHAARNRQDLATLLAIRSFAARAEHRAEGHNSVTGWLEHHLHLSKRAAARLARLSRFVAAHPCVEDGMAAGHLSLDHVAAIADRYRTKHAEAWDAALPQIVEDAKTMRFSDLTRDLLAFANNLDPEGAAKTFEDLLEDRRFQKIGSADFDEHGLIRAWLDPISYRIFANEHDRIVDQLFAEDRALATELLGRTPDAAELAHLTRTIQQRAHDALIEMARRSRTLAGGTVAAAAEVVLHTTLETYEAAEAHKATGVDLVIPDDGFCEIDDGTPVSPVAAVYAALDGQVRRIVFDARSEIIDYGYARRPYTTIQAGALRAKYRRCVHPYGCDRTGPHLQTDHHIEVQDGGRTDITNGRPMDGPHNRWKTNTRGQDPPPGPTDTGQRRGPPRWTRPHPAPPDDEEPDTS